MKKKIVLGSQSVWRRTMLDQAGIHSYEVMPADIDEKSIRDTDPYALVLRLAHAKADALIPRCEKDTILITSDQVIMCNGEVIEKPSSREELYHFFELYAQYPVIPISSVVVTDIQSEKRLEAVREGKILFSPFTTEEIEVLASEEMTYRCAGGLLLEHEIAKKHIISMEGDFSTIMGMPIEQTLEFISLFEK